MSKATPTILVIIGITGDLAKRKLLPAIENLSKAGVLPAELEIVGISRRPVEPGDVLADAADVSASGYLAKRLHMYRMDLEQAEDYGALGQFLEGLSNKFSQPAQYLFYVSVPPQAARPVIRHLGHAGFGRKQTKLLLEKPFGSDLTSAQELIDEIHEHFNEDQIYRIDHYLAKEMTQNIVVFRNGNSLFKRTWNKEFIESIEVIASEKIGIEGRTTFYEQTGALRDIVQSHLLQVAALTLMELPETIDFTCVPDCRLAALQSLRLADPDVQKSVIRGQYAGYEDEVKNPNSQTETFVSLLLASNAERWQGVPIRLTTGKNLTEKYTEVRIQYKQADGVEANQLIVRIQPREGIEFAIWSKQPGFGRELEKVALSFNFDNHSATLPEAYERVFLDAIQSDHTLFTSSEEVMASWRILEPIQRAWSMSSEGLFSYKPGSDAQALLGEANLKLGFQRAADTGRPAQ